MSSSIIRRTKLLGALLFAACCGTALSASPARAASVGAVARDACERALEREGADPRNAISSREACHQALLFLGQPEDFRNEVASMLAPGRKVTLDDLSTASMLADAALRKEPTLPWGYLARCDIARRIGSADVLAACLEGLRRIAPDHAVTIAALIKPAERVSSLVWLARGLLLTLVLATLAHALVRARRSRRGRTATVSQPVAAVIVLLCALVAHASPASAATEKPKGDLSIFPINDADPGSSVPDDLARAQQPLQFGYFIQDLTARAEAATKRGDHAAAARYYEALAKTAPDVAIAPRRLCESLQAAGDLPNAVKACRTALTKGGAVVADFARFVSLALMQPDPLPVGEKDELDAVLKHLDEKAGMGFAGELSVLHCEVALRFHDRPALEKCTSTLGNLAPNDAKTVSFQWALAVDRHDRDAALQLIDRAKTLGVGEEGLATMTRATDAMHRRRVTLWALIGVGAAAVLLVAVGATRRRATARRPLSA
jgi:hypothetical protein